MQKILKINNKIAIVVTTKLKKQFKATGVM